MIRPLGIALAIQRELPDVKGAWYVSRPGYTIVFGHDPADAERVKREVGQVIHDEDAKAGPFTWAIVIPGDQADAMMNLLHGDDEDGRDEAEAAIIGAALPIRWWSPARWAQEVGR